MIERVEGVHSRNLVAWARDRPEVIVLSGDLTGSTEIAAFRAAYPDRFFSLGMAEQNMLSWAGGMAREGLTPFLHSFAVFLYRRPFDQLSMSVAYPNLKVRIFGFLPGITTPGGATHQAIEDLAVLRAVPNLTVLEVGDATEVESVLDVAHAVDGPVYVRMLRGAIPRLFDPTASFQLNRARVLSIGDDIALITSGIATEQGMRAAQALRRRGVSVHHLHVSTLKPFSDPQITDAASRVKHAVITVENHSVIGGLGSAVAERVAEAGARVPLIRMGLADTYSHGASLNQLMREHGLTAAAVVRTVERAMGVELGIDEAELEATDIEPLGAPELTQLEAL